MRNLKFPIQSMMLISLALASCQNSRKAVETAPSREPNDAEAAEEETTGDDKAQDSTKSGTGLGPSESSGKGQITAPESRKYVGIDWDGLSNQGNAKHSVEVIR